ncbi:MAG: hypothetical protein CL811_01710 [Colwelliaceae bacterium]|nr:hypothetical protein [Colwelliaceae bacterium]
MYGNTCGQSFSNRPRLKLNIVLKTSLLVLFAEWRNLNLGFPTRYKNYSNKTGENEERIVETSYWQENLRLILICLAIWFIVSFGFGLLLVEPLNAIRLGGYKLGFWFAQQGSIYTFVGLIFWYTHKMNQLDKKYNVEDE